MSSQIQITENLYEYMLQHGLRESDLLKALREATLKTPHAQMLSAPDEVQFICLLAKLLAAKHVIEVGVFTGYTSLALALSLPPDGKVVACDISDTWVKLGMPYWEQAGVRHKIDFRLGKATDTLNALLASAAATYDLIYIDADKQGYDGYYEQSLKLLRAGGIVLLDNMLQDGRIADSSDNNPSVAHIRTLLSKLQHDLRIDFSLLPLADGLGIARKL